MRQKILTTALLLLGILISAQEFLVPFKQENRYGLMNQKGEIIVQPEYDNLDWQTADYFLSTQSEKEFRGLLKGSKEIITPSHYRQFKIIPGVVILAMAEPQIGEFHFVLFDSEGKQLGPEYRRLELIGTMNDGREERYAVIFIEDFNQHFSLFIYDSVKEEIEKYLFEDVQNFKMLTRDITDDSYYMSFEESGKLSQKRLQVNEHNYVFEDFEILPEQKIIGVDSSGNLERNQEVRENSHSASEEKKSIRGPHYVKEEGKVFFRNSETEKELNPEGVEFFFSSNQRDFQIENLIYKKNDKYGMIHHGEFMEAKYDSLIYFGNSSFLFCEKENNKNRCGTLNRIGEIEIPAVYDSIFGKRKKFTFHHSEETNKNSLITIGDEASGNPYYQSVSRDYTVYKDGKAGIIKPNGDVIIPFEYDEIAENAVIKGRADINTEYVVLREENYYGLIFKDYDKDSRQSISMKIDPIYAYYPAYYFKDYYGIKGLNLFALFTEQGEFESFTTEFGQLFRP